VVVLAVHVAAFVLVTPTAEVMLDAEIRLTLPPVTSLGETLRTFSVAIVTGGSSGIGKSFIGLVQKLNPGLVICNLSRRPPVINISGFDEKKLNHFPCDLSRPEEVAQARASLAAAEADVNNAETAFARVEKLRASGDIAQQEFDAAKFRVENIRARRDSEKKRLDLLLNGSRKEDIRGAEEKLRQAEEAERLVLAGPRAEEIADARAQLSEAQARLEQIDVQLKEGVIAAPSDATVEVLTVRPGDLLTPNQSIARLLEKDQIFVRVFVPEPQLGLVRTGQQADVKVDTFPNQPFQGVIEQINTQGEFTPRNVQSRDERNHQVFGVKVRIDNRDGKLKAGMAADVIFR